MAMAYEVIYNPKEDCVHGRIEGQVDLALVHEYGKEIVRQLRAHHCLRFLNDMRQALVTLSTVEIYDLPAWIEEAGMDRSCKRALLVAEDFDDYQFFETVSRNHGQLVEVFADSSQTAIFRDIAEARAWLGLPAARARLPPLEPVSDPDAQRRGGT
jgi:hypothetical protein